MQSQSEQQNQMKIAEELHKLSFAENFISGKSLITSAIEVKLSTVE